MAIRFPKIEKFLFCIPLRIGLIITTFIFLVLVSYVTIMDKIEGNEPAVEFSAILTLFIFFICLFTPIKELLFRLKLEKLVRCILISFRNFVIVLICLTIFIFIVITISFINSIDNGFTFFIMNFIYIVISSLIIIYYLICAGSYTEKVINEIDVREKEAKAEEAKAEESIALNIKK